MKKLFTLIGLVSISFWTIAQNNTLLNEDFEDANIDASLTSINSGGIFGTSNSINNYMMWLNYNTKDSLGVGLFYSPTPNGQAADLITVTYDVKLLNPNGTLSQSGTSITYKDFLSVPISFGAYNFTYEISLEGTELVDNCTLLPGFATVKKTFSTPIGTKLPLIEFGFTPTYSLAGFSASTPAELANKVCPAYFTNPFELLICSQEVVNKTPILRSKLLVDNINIVSSNVTGIESGSNEIAKTPIAAYDLIGKEISLDSKDEMMIVKYSDGSAARTYNTQK